MGKSTTTTSVQTVVMKDTLGKSLGRDRYPTMMKEFTAVQCTKRVYQFPMSVCAFEQKGFAYIFMEAIHG